jgi:ATP-dependent Lon protease
MSSTNLPVLFLTDLVVLPGMVVSIELDEAARAAVDAARSHSDGSLLVAPRLEDRYASVGVVAEIVQLGRLRNGDEAAVIKADRRVRIGSGVSGPGTALWIEVTELDDQPVNESVSALATEYKQVTIATLQRRDAWQVIDQVNRITDPSQLADLAGYAPWLTDAQKRQLLETPDVAERLTVLVEWSRAHLAETEVNDRIAEDVREGMEKNQREFLLRQQLNAIRKELGEDEPDGAQD